MQNQSELIRKTLKHLGENCKSAEIKTYIKTMYGVNVSNQLITNVRNPVKAKNPITMHTLKDLKQLIAEHGIENIQQALQDIIDLQFK